MKISLHDIVAKFMVRAQTFSAKMSKISYSMSKNSFRTNATVDKIDVEKSQ